MAIYKLQEDRIAVLEQTTFSTEKIGEARDLQKFIINSIEAIEKGLFVLSSEFGDWEDSKRRIDILCLDKDANLVVVELKRTEDGGHMELQSIRYAAMVANMTFDKAIEVHTKYLKKNVNSDKDAEQEILRFLEWSERSEDKFANDVRIILVSANFSIEITTSVLWLLEMDIDIKCIRIKPQRDGENLYFDIQQIIPLPEAADYQVKIREKVAEQRQARRENQKDYSKFNLTFSGSNYPNLNKRATMILTIKKCVENGISPSELMKFTGSQRWLSVNKICRSQEEFKKEFNLINERKYDPLRWFNADDELLLHDGKTYVFSNQHGKGTGELVSHIFAKFPELNATVEKIDG